MDQLDSLAANSQLLGDSQEGRGITRTEGDGGDIRARRGQYHCLQRPIHRIARARGLTGQAARLCLSCGDRGGLQRRWYVAGEDSGGVRGGAAIGGVADHQRRVICGQWTHTAVAIKSDITHRRS